MSYTSQEDCELNKQLKKWQNRARRLILSNYYDIAAENLSENTFAILQKITNAKSHKNIQPYLWNSGIIEMTLDNIANEIKKSKKINDLKLSNIKRSIIYAKKHFKIFKKYAYIKKFYFLHKVSDH